MAGRAGVGRMVGITIMMKEPAMLSVWNPSTAAPCPDLQRFVDLACIMGTDDFTTTLLDCLAHWVPSEHFCVLRMDKEHPSMLLAGTRYRDPRLVWRCWHAYSRQFHAYDDLYSRMQSQHQADHGLLIGHILAEDIQFAPYREDVYQRNGMGERLSGLTWDADGTPLLFNLYRQRESGYFQDREIGDFEQLTPALLQLLKGHLAMRRGGSRPDDWRPILLRRAPQLTEQELEVCVRVLQGMTHAAIAADMSIKETTVKTYRNRAFVRLGINFRSQLFALVR